MRFYLSTWHLFLQACVIICVNGRRARRKQTEIPYTNFTGTLWTWGTLWSILNSTGTTWVDLTTESSTSAETTTVKDIESVLKKAKVIPNVVDRTPAGVVYVSYYHFSWSFGQTFDQTDVNEPPHHCWWVSEDNAYYTLMIVGPDFPGEDDHSLAQYPHWLVVNIPGIWIDGGETLAAYVGEEPYGRGRHRFVIVIFKQPGKEKLKFNEELVYTKKDVFNRGNFSAMAFARKYRMGEPVALNFCVLDMDLLPTPFY